MQIENVLAPPARTASRPSLKYRELTATLASSTGWLRIPLLDLGGKDTRTKRGTVIQSARNAGIKAETRTDANYLYVRRIAIAELER